MIPRPSPALFLDRDGVINVDHGYVHRIDDFEFIPGIFSLVRRGRELGYRIIVVTNQAGIGRGYYSEAQFLALSEWMQARFEAEGAPLDAIYHCPHHPEHGIGVFRQDSPDRKPRPGMLLRAAKEWNLDLLRSALVGDRASDIQAAVAAGIPHRFLVRSDDRSDQAVIVADLAEVMQRLPACR
jgi:D-glycero-D-manno-heptose 1,7-bisphosphate phosphatase